MHSLVPDPTPSKVRSPLQSLLRGWLFSFLVFGLISIILVGQFAVAESMPWTQALRNAARDWLSWAILAPLIFRFVERFPIDRNRLGYTLAVHISCAVVIMMLCTFWAEVVLPPNFLPNGPHPHPPRNWWLIGATMFRLPIYLVIVTLAHAIFLSRRDQERTLREQEHTRRTLSLEASLAKARLESLKAQLQPHFLFNSLNAIAELVHLNPDAADEMIAALSDLLRLSLETSAEQQLPLSREMEFVERYLAIERVRFGARLEAVVDLPRELHEAMVPAFLLQPLVENAIRHGLERKRGKGSLRIQARRRGETLQLTVSDDGVGLPKGGELHQGIGLTNTRARLRELYEGAARMELRESNGLTVEITLPWRRAPLSLP